VFDCIHVGQQMSLIFKQIDIIEHNRKYNYTQMSASHQSILQQISKLYNFITLCKTFTDNTLKKDKQIDCTKDIPSMNCYDVT
jgi:hypothetical protein